MQFPTVSIPALINGTSHTLTISPCNLAELATYQKQAIQEHLGFTTNTDYFMVRDENNRTLGFCGVIFYKHKAIFKSVYVFPEFRKNGLWKMMFEYRKAICMSIPTIRYIEATCTAMSFGLYQKLGAVVVKRFKTHSFTKVHLFLER